MIIDYSGKGATAIFQDLAGKGVNVESLADLLQQTNSPTTRDVPRYFKIENNEIIDSSNSPIIDTPTEQTGTVGLTLAEDFPGASSTTPQNRLGAKSPTEIVKDADTSVNITETLSTPTLEGDPEVEAQIQNFLTVNDQAEQEVIQTNLENPVLENAGEPTTEEVKVSANQKVPVSTDFMFQDGQSKPFGMRQDKAKQTTITKVPEEKLKEIITSYETILRAKETLASQDREFDIKELKAERKAIDEIKAQEEAFNIRQEARVQAQKKREEKLLTDINSMNEEYRAVEIEPNRIFKNSSTGAKILAALSVGLGAYSASMTEGKNYALEIIDGAIADDIEAQKLELKQKGASIDDKRNLLNDLIKRGMSEAEAEQASRLMLLQKVQRTLQQRMLDIKDARMKSEGKDMEASLKLKIEEQKVNLMMNTLPREQTVTETKMVPSPEMAAQIKAMEANLVEKAKLKAKYESEQELKLSPKERDARKIEGYVGLAPDATEARTFRKFNTEVNTLLKQLDKLIEFRKDIGILDIAGLDREKIADGQALAVTAAMDIKNVFDLGVLAGPDMDLIEKVLPTDPTGSGYLLSRYKQAKRYIELKRDNMAANMGIFKERPEMDISKGSVRERAEQSREAALAE
jgi:hypothetical protein